MPAAGEGAAFTPAWVESTSAGSRGTNRRMWHDPENPNRKHITASLARLCYPSGSPDDPADTPLDPTPVAVNNAALNGWRVTANGWHYGLGIPAGKATDGWVGFGGRAGAHVLWTRLARVGYLHWPTRTWQGLQTPSGGDVPPDYTRTNLSSTVQSKTLGPEGGKVSAPVSSVATWASIWTTPGSGRLDIRWRISGLDLKEDIILNQAAREWIAANRPPLTPATETYFGFVFQVDASDLPKWLRGAVQLDLASGTLDVDDDADWRAKDALDRLLAFMPISYAFVDDAAATQPPKRKWLKLKRRLWRDGSDLFLLIGARADQLNALPGGTVTFDPTFTVAETNEDGASYGTDEATTPANHPLGLMYFGFFADNMDAAWIWRGTGIGSGDTIDTATITLVYGNDNLGTVAGDIFGFAVDSPSDFAAADVHRISDHHTRTSASVSDGFVTSTGNHTTPSIVSPFQEVVNRAGFAGDVGFTWRNTDTVGDTYYTFKDFTTLAADAPDLNVTFTAAGGGTTRGMPFEGGTAFNGGRCLVGNIR